MGAENITGSREIPDIFYLVTKQNTKLAIFWQRFDLNCGILAGPCSE